jgi:transcriptional regulator with XRE-family HTH domain
MRRDRLKQRREELGLSQADLAARLKTDGNTIYRYEKEGSVDPTSEAVEKLARELTVTSDWLLGLVPDKHSHLEEEALTPDERRLLDAARKGQMSEIMKAALELTEHQNQSGVSGNQPATNS